MENVKILALSLIVLASCGTPKVYPKYTPPAVTPLGPAVETPKEGEKPDTRSFVSGLVAGTDGAAINLIDHKNENMVIMFSQDVCGPCIEEMKDLLDALPNRGAATTNPRLVTILVGDDESLANKWKLHWQIPWGVYFDENGDLYNQYCPEGETPCVFVQSADKGIALRRVGKVTIQEIKDIVGEFK